MFESQLVIGIDIGSFNTKIVTGQWNGKKIIMDKEMVTPTPENVYSDGYILDVKMMAEFIEAMLKDAKVKKGAVVFSTESTEIIMREMLLPWAAEKDLRAMLPYEVEKYFPVNTKDYTAEYQVIDEPEEDGMKNMRVQVAVMPNMMIEKYWALAAELRLKPLALEIQPMSCSKLFSYRKYGQDETIALIDGGHTKMRFTIINKGKIDFSRVIPRGSKELDEKLSNGFEVPITQARVLKEKGNLREDFESDDFEIDKINQLIEEKLDEWFMELQPNIRYYLALKEGNKIDKVFVYGGLFEIPGMEVRVQEVFHRPTSVLSTIDLLEDKKREDATSLGILANVIGSIIQE